MNSKQRTSLVVALVAGVAVLGAGCSDRDSGKTAAVTPSKSTATMTPPADRPATRAGAVIDDSMITTSVKTAVLAEPGLSALKIEVDTKDGVVTLSGTVASSDLKTRATQIAKNTSGVRSVVDKLEVKAG